MFLFTKYKKTLIVFILLFKIINIYSQNLDINILKSINSSHLLKSDKYFQFISNSTAVVNIGAPLTIAIVGLANHDSVTFKNACVMGAASLICGGLTYAVKYIVNRSRPFEAYPSLITKKSYGGDPSFPSSHTSAAFATATSLSLIYPKWYVIVLSYTWAGIVAYSRMHLGVHYPTDILGGIIIGIGTSYLSFKAQKWLNAKNKKPDGRKKIFN
jgi:membrane-associated phospholipid phosphatase